MAIETVGSKAVRESCEADWVRDRRLAWLWPAALGTAGVGWLAAAGSAGALVAAAGFAVAGVLCAANALRCGRVHCAITGPLYLVAALLFLARAGGWVPVPGSLVMAGAIAGTLAAFVPEWLGRRYFAAPAQARSALAAFGSLVSAGLVGVCCLGPTLFLATGVSVAGLGTLGALEPLRPLFLAAGLGLWALAYRQRRRAAATCHSGACEAPVTRRTGGVLLWGSLVALVVAAIYPYVVAHLAGG